MGAGGGPDGSAATIHDYDDNALLVIHDGAGEAPDLTCSVDGDGATLLADGLPIAVLPGAAGIDLDAVRLVAA